MPDTLPPVHLHTVFPAVMFIKNILNNSHLNPLYPWNIKSFLFFFLNKKCTWEKKRTGIRDQVNRKGDDESGPDLDYISELRLRLAVGLEVRSKKKKGTLNDW